MATTTQKEDLFDYPYENILPKGNYQQRYQTKSRMITSNREDLSLPDNSIQTAKYTLINFVPKQLFLQISKLSNLYFLVIGVMQIIPQVSISNQIPVIFMPLSVIILVSALKDLYEDYKRQMSDREENNRLVKVLSKEGFVDRAWRDVRVGNIIKIEQDQFLPADLLLLRSSEKKGVCYVETKSLDGETNLKMKNVNSELIKYYLKETDITTDSKRIILKYEAPNPYLYRFYGEVIDADKKNFGINFNNFMLRGCTLRNVRYIIGLVAYTGHDTKIMLNSFKARSKKSKLEIKMQNQIFYIFVVQMCICIFAASYYLVWYNLNKRNLEYLNINLHGVVDNSPPYNFFVRFGNWVLIFTNFVPISLLVTLEMVKFVQGILIMHDSEMNQPLVQSSNLNEELGQIEYVFSDKTGTLTSNIMEFKQITIGTKKYGENSYDDGRFIKDISGFPSVTNVDFRDQQLFDDLKDPTTSKRVLDCLMFLATCHTVITDTKDDQQIYNASSPDELALVNFAKFCGVEYVGTDENNIISVKYEDNKYEFELLEVFEFTSSRKRQSVIVRRENEIWLYTKGADSVLLDPLRLSKNEQEQKAKLKTMNENLKKYGEDGLRTLVLSKRLLDPTYFNQWKANYTLASTELVGRAEKMQALQDEIEVNFDIVGSTAIEDKLQVDVGSTIEAIKKAGIKVWVLTGDKIETAINIGYSCKLLTNQMKQHLIDEKEERMIRNALDEVLQDLQLSKNQPSKGIAQQAQINGFQALCGAADSLTNVVSSRTPSEQQHALIISGDSLFHALKPGISQQVMAIAEKCQVVLCCRVSPKQKQDVVALVRKEKPEVSTLAIGDGANDVNMIRAAHVGIGIKGVEGQQAVRASDYAVNEFRQLRRLLFYHGRESYRRNSNLVCYNFFKNTLLVLPQFWYGALSVFSAQSLYDSFLYQLFNILYASMPIIIYAVFDEEYDPYLLVENKRNYYAQGPSNLLFNSKVFWLQVVNAAWQASVICYFSIYIFGNNFIMPDGYVTSIWGEGTMVYGLVVLVSNFKIMIFSNTHTIMTFVGLVGSLLSYLFSWLIIDTIHSAEAYQVLQQLWETPNFHLGNVVIIASTSLLDLGVHFYLKWSFNPNKIDGLSKSEEINKVKIQESFKGGFMVVSKQMTQQKGYIQKNQQTHTGFAFCALEREEKDNNKDEYKY